jgi:anti-sigma B factor antagonist
MDISEIEKLTALALSGKSMQTANRLKIKFRSNQLRNTAAVVDLSQLDYVSSSGLRVFLLAAKRLQATDGKIVLCALKDQIRQVFDLAGFSSFLSTYGSRAEAIKGL